MHRGNETMKRILISDNGRYPAPDVAASLSRRLKKMQRDCDTVALAGGGLGSAEVEHLGRTLRDLAHQAQMMATGRAPQQNPQVLSACQLVFNAEGVLNHAFMSLRDRLEEREADPSGQILATLRAARSTIEMAEAALCGRAAS